MSEEDWDISEWECFEKNVASISINAEALKQKMNLEEEAFNTVNDLFDKTNHNDKKVELDTKAKPVKPQRPNTGRPRPASGRLVKPMEKHHQKKFQKAKNKEKNSDDDADEDEELDYCCDITDKILSRCK